MHTGNWEFDNTYEHIFPLVVPSYAKTCLGAYADSEGQDQHVQPRSLIRPIDIR